MYFGDCPGTMCVAWFMEVEEDGTVELFAWDCNCSGVVIEVILCALL